VPRADVRAERCERHRACHPVDREPGISLEPSNGPLRLVPVGTVRRSPEETLLNEQELEDGDVPPARSQAERAPAEERMPEAPELPTRAAPGGAAGREADAALETAEREARRGAGDPVDLAGVETERLERYLETRNLDALEGLRLGCRERGE